MQRLGEFSMQAVTNMVWALATVKQPVEKLFTALGRQAEQQHSQLNVQAVANTAWAFATVLQS